MKRHNPLSDSVKVKSMIDKMWKQHENYSDMNIEHNLPNIVNDAVKFYKMIITSKLMIKNHI